MGRYSHLTIEACEDIMCLCRQEKGVSEIVRSIGRDKSTVSRELRRNSCARQVLFSGFDKNHLLNA